LDNDNNGIPKVKIGPISWLDSLMRHSIERAISEYREHPWKIKSEKDFSEFAYHRAAVISDDSFAVFLKCSTAPEAVRQFEIEIANLKFLSEKAGVQIPNPIAILQVQKETLLIMEALETIERGPRQWREIGATLARIHQVPGSDCGFDIGGYWGPLYQDNRPISNWNTFFRERRLLPLLKTAVDSGNLPASTASKVELLAGRLPQLCGLNVTPVLLHGDAQQNNFISTMKGTFIIDPAVYYGNPEIDLALLDSFQPVPEDVFNGYRDELPIDPGFPERKDLWRIPLYLAAVALEGPMHLMRLTGAVNRYL
jgi:fructosamine-3-kinase